MGIDKSKILNELQLTGLHTLDQDIEEISSINSLRGRDLSSLSDTKLSYYTFIAVQYQMYLQLHYNVRRIEYLQAKRAYEFALNKALASIPGKQTVKEKIGEAMKDPDLVKLESELADAENKYHLLDKMPEALLEIANSLKKELSLRNKPGK